MRLGLLIGGHRLNLGQGELRGCLSCVVRVRVNQPLLSAEPRFQLGYVILMGVFLEEHWGSRGTHPEVNRKLLRCRWLRVRSIHWEARPVQAVEQLRSNNFAIVQCT